MKIKTILWGILLTSSLGLNAQNNCLQFDGSDDYVDCGTINLSGSAITLECWVNVDLFQSNDPFISTLIGTEVSASNIALLRLGDATLAPNKAQFVLLFGSSEIKLNGNTLLLTNTWYHIAATYDGSNMKIYINGILDASSSQSGSFTSFSTFNIAKSLEGRYLNGKIDEIRVWTDARTEQEIRENMCQTIIGNEPGLVAYYKMNETTGTNLHDETTNNNDGTLNYFTGTYWIDSEAFTTWNGSVSADWATPGNWTDGVPDQYDNVGITNDGTSPSSTGDIEINNLVVCTGASLDLNNASSGHTTHGNVFNIGTTTLNDIDLTIEGSLYLLPASTLNIEPAAELTVINNVKLLHFISGASLNIKSTASGTGSLIINGNLSNDQGTITTQRYISGSSNNWHFLSSPVTNQEISGNFIDANGYDFYLYNEPSNEWINRKNLSSGGGSSPFFNIVNQYCPVIK